MRRLLVPHLALWIVGGALIRVAIVPPEVCPVATATEARQAAISAGDWLARSIGEDGRFAYGYRRDVDEVPTEYNSARHTAAMLTLYQLAEAGEQRFVAEGDRALRYVLDNLIAAGGRTAFAEGGGDAPLGANGLLVAALVTRRVATGDPSFDGLMIDIGHFLVGQQQENGSMLAFWDRQTEAPLPDTYGIFATGEAFWGMTLIDGQFPHLDFRDPALSVAYYLARDRDRLEGQTSRYPDHWAAYGMAELGPDLLDNELIANARRLAGFFSIRLRVESQRTGEGVNVLVRGWPGPPSGVGTAGEGMAALWRLSAADTRLADMRAGMEDDLRCYAGMMVEGQIGAEEAAAYDRPGLGEGAWFYRDYSQMDDQQHNISALLAVFPLLEEAS
ncbi:MAG: hypothetical protein OES13_01705 [Acidimicrobiia bacterium]|nr:hypothetical protein [Acidimicrobiia bacterium]